MDDDSFETKLKIVFFINGPTPASFSLFSFFLTTILKSEGIELGSIEGEHATTTTAQITNNYSRFQLLNSSAE